MKTPVVGVGALANRSRLPELVGKGQDKDGLLSVNYIGLLPVLVKGMQEQQATIADLRARLTTLEEQLQRLGAQESRQAK